MANVIKHKRGSGSDPSASNLVIGELAIRTDNGKLFTKMDSGAIAEIAGGGSDIAINTLSSSSATGGGSATFNGSAYRFTLSSPPSVSAQQLLVSVNGVVQKPVAGTGQPSEGYSVDGSDIIFGDAPATGSDFFILTFRSLGVSEPADNSVTSAKIVDGTIVGTDLATNIDLVDNQTLRFGTGNDLQISHSGNHSFIKDVGTGSLFICSNSFNVNNAAANETIIRGTQNGAVELFYDNSKKFETSTQGVETTGGLLVDTVDPVVNVGSTYTYKYGYFGDTDKQSLTVRGNEACIEVFASEQSFHAGSILLRGGNEGFGFVNNSSDNRLELVSFTASADSFALHNNGANLSNYDKVFVANKNGSVDLYHNNSKKLETTSSGVKFTGTLEAVDNQSILLGTSNDFRIRHTGSNSEITDEGTGKLRLGSNQTEIRSADLSTVQAQFISGGAVNLYHDNNKKFETTSSGVEITGTNILLNDDSAITGTPHTYTYARGGGETSGLSLYGAESALEIVSSDDGTHGGSLLLRTVTDGVGLVYNPTDNALEIKTFTPSSNSFAIHNNGSHTTQDTQLRVVADGGVELNHNGTKKFETASYGIKLPDQMIQDCYGINSGGEQFRMVIPTGTSGGFRILVHHADGSLAFSDSIANFYNTQIQFLKDTQSRRITPEVNNTYDLGSTSQRWRNVYTNDLNLSNEGGSNDVDGTWGSYTIQEGAEDLFLVNKRNGKKYKFNLTEVS